MRIVHLNPVSNNNPPTFLQWVINVGNYINSPPGDISHLVVDVYSKEIDNSLPSTGRYNEGQFRVVSDLSQNLPSLWQGFVIKQ